MTNHCNIIPYTVLIFRIFFFFAIIVLIPLQTSAQDFSEYRHILQQGSEAGIESERLETLVSRAVSHQIAPDELNRLTTPATTLAERDLPYDPLLQKAMEGMAKQVPLNTIHQVLEQMAGNMIRSTDLVDPWMARSEILNMIEAGKGNRETADVARNFRNMVLENTSYALQQNMRKETIQNFLDQLISEKAIQRSGMSTIASAIRVLPDMPSSQDHPETSNRILIRALMAGFNESEIHQLPEAFRLAAFRSQLPAESIARGMEQQMQQGLPANRILENLFRGNIGGGPPGFTPPGLERSGQDDQERGRGRRPEGPPDNQRPPGTASF